VEYPDNGSALTWQMAYFYLGARLLATQAPGTAPSATQFHHKDRLGTRLISNAGDTTASENVVLPYGALVVAESGTMATSRRFTSYDRGSTVVLDYAVNRFYDCYQGRFTQLDPMGPRAAQLRRPQRLNRYSYVHNDPVNFVDPDGRLDHPNPDLCELGFVQYCPSWDDTFFYDGQKGKVGPGGAGGSGGDGGRGGSPSNLQQKQKEFDNCYIDAYNNAIKKFNDSLYDIWLKELIGILGMALVGVVAVLGPMVAGGLTLVEALLYLAVVQPGTTGIGIIATIGVGVLNELQAAVDKSAIQRVFNDDLKSAWNMCKDKTGFSPPPNYQVMNGNNNPVQLPKWI